MRSDDLGRPKINSLAVQLLERSLFGEIREPVSGIVWLLGLCLSGKVPPNLASFQVRGPAIHLITRAGNLWVTLDCLILSIHPV